MIDKQAVNTQEGHGQRVQLPINVERHFNHDVRAILEAAGVKFLGAVDGNEMLQRVELPEGWKKIPTKHRIRSILVDNAGRERASIILYKTRTEIRIAHMSLCRRFNVIFDDKVGMATVMDGNKVIFITDPISSEENDGDVRIKVTHIAVAWLDRKYPDWQNPCAYWED